MALDELRGSDRQHPLSRCRTASCHQPGSRIALLSLRLILRRMWQRPLVLEHLTEITAVDPATTGRTSDEMLRFVLRWIANAFAEVFSARNIGHRGPPVKREGYPLAGVFPVTGFTRWTRAQAGHRIEM